MNDYLNIAGNFIHPTAIIGANVLMGRGNIIMPYTVIGQPGFIRNAEAAKGMIKIGDNNKIGCHVSIMAGENGDTKIGNNNLLMNYVNVGHDVVVGDNCEVGVGSVLAGYSEISDNVKIKIGVLIRNRKKVGEKALVGMGAVVVEDIPANAVVYGNPARRKT